MTTSASSHGSHPPSDSPWGAGPGDAIRISDPGTLISAVPALLGFHPHRSLVAICLTGTSVGAVMRHDLVLDDIGPGRRMMDRVLDQFASVAAREGADRMLAVMVDDRIPVPARPADLVRHSVIAERLRDALWCEDVDLLGMHVCSTIADGAAWCDIDGVEFGTIPDPSASAVAAAQVVGGRAIRGSRDELEAVLTPAPQSVRERIGCHIDAARETSDAPDPRTMLERVLARIAERESGDEMPLHEYADLALALEVPTVRDSLLALSGGTQAAAAEQMWIHLASALPDPERAEPLALLAYGAYLRGDGPMAGVALSAALDADPWHRLASLLDGALRSGIRPEGIRELAVVGRESARDLGVELPPVDPLPPRGV